MDDEKENMDEMDESTDDLSLDDLDMDSDMDMGGSWDDMDMDSTVGESSSGDNKGKLILLLLLIVIGAGSATFIAYKMYGGRKDAGLERQEISYSQPEIPMISKQEAEVIGRERHEMRFEERSDRSSRFTSVLPEDPLYSVTARTDLILIAGLFDNYVVALSNFFELGRLITNEYVQKRENINSIYNSELMPKFNYAERRRKQLRQRISSELTKPLLSRLEYIAYHDSIAVNDLGRYLENGKDEDFTTALDVGYKAKLMKKEYLKTFNRILKDNNVVWQRDEKLWTKYFGTWDQVEP